MKVIVNRSTLQKCEHVNGESWWTRDASSPPRQCHHRSGQVAVWLLSLDEHLLAGLINITVVTAVKESKFLVDTPYFGGQMAFNPPPRAYPLLIKLCPEMIDFLRQHLFNFQEQSWKADLWFSSLFWWKTVPRQTEINTQTQRIHGTGYPYKTSQKTAENMKIWSIPTALTTQIMEIIQ